MNQIIEAVYEHGGFRVLSVEDLLLKEGQQVRLTIENTGEDLLELAAEVYAGLSTEDIEEVERIALDRRDFFEREKE